MTMMRNTVRRLKWTMRIRRIAAFSLGIATTVLAAPRPASAVPAFARKYGVRCTVCHEAWPVLNDFGRAFRDNGYRMNLGKDEPTATEPAYWPVFAAAQPHFGFDLVKSHGAATETTRQRDGQFQSGVSLLGAIGTLGEHASYLVIPVAAVNGLTLGFPAAWIRFNNLFDSSWLNVRVGSAEPDLPISRIRDLDLTGAGLGAYAYHTPGSRRISTWPRTSPASSSWGTAAAAARATPCRYSTSPARWRRRQRSIRQASTATSRRSVSRTSAR